jgi:hypothetical protein
MPRPSTPSRRRRTVATSRTSPRRLTQRRGGVRLRRLAAHGPLHRSPGPTRRRFATAGARATQGCTRAEMGTRPVADSLPSSQDRRAGHVAPRVKRTVLRSSFAASVRHPGCPLWLEIDGPVCPDEGSHRRRQETDLMREPEGPDQRHREEPGHRAVGPREEEDVEEEPHASILPGCYRPPALPGVPAQGPDPHCRPVERSIPESHRPLANRAWREREPTAVPAMHRSIEGTHRPTTEGVTHTVTHSVPSVGPRTCAIGRQAQSDACSGGEVGIRTLGTVSRTPVFETGPFDHSGTSPRSDGGT